MSESNESEDVVAKQSGSEDSDKRESKSSESADESETSSYSTCSVRSETSGSSKSTSQSTSSNECIEPSQRSASSGEEVEDEEDVTLTKQSPNKVTAKLPSTATPKVELVKEEEVSSPASTGSVEQEAIETNDSPLLITPAKSMVTGNESPDSVFATPKPPPPTLPSPRVEQNALVEQPKVSKTDSAVKKSSASNHSKGVAQPPTAADTSKTPSKSSDKPHKKSKHAKEPKNPKDPKKVKEVKEVKESVVTAASSSTKRSHKSKSSDEKDGKEEVKVPAQVVKVKKEPADNVVKEAKKRTFQEVKDDKTEKVHKADKVEKVKKAKHSKESKPPSSSGSLSSESSFEEPAAPVAPVAPVAPARISKISGGRKNQQLAMSKAKFEGTIRDMEVQEAEVTDALKIIDTTKFVFRPTHAYPLFHHVSGVGLAHVKQHLVGMQGRYGPVVKNTANVNLILTRDLNQAKKTLLGPSLNNKFAARIQFDNDLKRAAPSSTQGIQADVQAPSTSAEGAAIEFEDIPAADDEPSTSSKHATHSSHNESTDQAKSARKAAKKRKKDKKESRSKHE